MLRLRRVRLEREGAVARLWLGGDGDAVNPLDPDLLEQLDQALAALEAETSIRCAVITGVGPAFAAGADLNHVQASSVAENLAYGDQLRHSFDRVAACRFPTIAAINGHALGGGWELALACTLRVAAAGVPLGLPEVRLGLLPAAGGVQRMARQAPNQIALEMMLTGRAVRAEEALERGLLCAVVPAPELDEAALEIARRIAANSPAAVRAVVESYRRGSELPLAEAQELTRAASAELLETMEWREGVAAFLERRRPEFAPQP